MSATFWRNVSIVLAVTCGVIWWRGRRAPAPPSATASAAPAAADSRRAWDGRIDPSGGRVDGDTDDADEPVDGVAGGHEQFFGVSVPSWLAWFAPKPGENLLDYRDRLLPFARAAIAPHRARVDRGLEDFAAIADLDAHQRAELDAAVEEAGAQIQDKVMQGILSGELMPQHFKPSTGVAFARDVLDVVDGANQRFVGSLRDDQRAALAEHPFDVADYFVFKTRWEDMLMVTE